MPPIPHSGVCGIKRNLVCSESFAIQRQPMRKQFCFSGQKVRNLTTGCGLEGMGATLRIPSPSTPDTPSQRWIGTTTKRQNAALALQPMAVDGGFTGTYSLFMCPDEDETEDESFRSFQIMPVTTEPSPYLQPVHVPRLKPRRKKTKALVCCLLV